MGSKINTQSADVGHRNAHRQSIFVFSYAYLSMSWKLHHQVQL
jgi:hypothetical protein